MTSVCGKTWVESAPLEAGLVGSSSATLTKLQVRRLIDVRMGRVSQIESLILLHSVYQALLIPTEKRESGELILRKSSLTIRIFFVAGRVAWAHCEGYRGHLFDALTSRHGIEQEKVRDLALVCRAEKRQFGDYIVDSGVLSEPDMRLLLCEHIQQHINYFVQAEGEMESSFLPLERRFESRFIFEVGEVVETATTKKDNFMTTMNDSLNKIMGIQGTFACALVDHQSGMTLGFENIRGDFNIEVAAAGNTDVVKSKKRIMEALGIQGGIEDILITLDDQYHLIRPLRRIPNLFLYVALDKATGNLGLARHHLAEIEKGLEI